MEWESIQKHPGDYVGAHLLNYEEYARTFSWAQARTLLDGLPGGGLNIAHEAIDRHVLAGRGDRLALRWIGRDNRIRDFSYALLLGPWRLGPISRYAPTSSRWEQQLWCSALR